MNQNKDVNVLLGDPQKAIIKFSTTMIIIMLAETSYNVINAIWLSGKGADALSAIGFFFPFLIFIMAVSTGLGIGGASVLSQAIGARDMKKASIVARHSVLVAVVTAIVLMFLAQMTIEPIYRLMGVDRSLDESVTYAKIMFYGLILFLFSSNAYALLRGEGQAKQTMIISVLGSILNIVLDPIFIYRFTIFNLEIGLNLGVQGAAIATLVSHFITSAILINILFSKNRSVFSINLEKFKYDSNIVKSILSIGIPASLAQLCFAVMMGVITFFVSKTGGEDSVAIFTAGWRIVLFAVLPVFGMALGVVPVFGAIFGAKDMNKFDIAYSFSIKFGLFMETVIAIVIFAFAPIITLGFTWSSETAQFAPQIVEYLRTVCFFFPGVIGGYLTASMFQGAGKGLYALAIIILWTIILDIPAAYLFGVLLDLGLFGINIGLIIGAWLSSIFAFIWARSFIGNQKGKYDDNLDTVSVN